GCGRRENGAAARRTPPALGEAEADNRSGNRAGADFRCRDRAVVMTIRISWRGQSRRGDGSRRGKCKHGNNFTHRDAPSIFYAAPNAWKMPRAMERSAFRRQKRRACGKRGDDVMHARNNAAGAEKRWRYDGDMVLKSRAATSMRRSYSAASRAMTGACGPRIASSRYLRASAASPPLV